VRDKTVKIYETYDKIKCIMIKTILSLFVLILIFAIVYVYIIKPSTSPSTPANQTSEINGDTYQVTDELQDQTSSIFIIEELGIKFQIPVELQDLTYSIDYMFGTRVALLSSASLIQSDISTGGSHCVTSGLGWISLHRQGDALYNPTGYYYAFNNNNGCSRSPETRNLQRDLTESLRKSFKTSTTLSPLSEVADQTFEMNGFTYQVTDELQDLTASIFTIEELGIKFQVTEELQDLTYSIEYWFGEPIAFLSSASLVRSDISTGGSYCAEAGLGRISLHRYGDGLYKPTGFYEQGHDVICSRVPETMYLQRYLLESLKKSLSFSSVE